MNYSRRGAADFGHEMAESLAAHSASIEAGLTQSPIYPWPVTHEPEYRAFDPLQTFESPGERTINHATSPNGWVLQRLIIPPLDSVDWHRTEALLASLAGLTGPLSFEVYADHQRATFYLGSTPAEREFVANAWLAAFPDSAITTATDPWEELQPDDLALCDLYSPAPYHRSMRTHPQVSPWRQLLRLCTRLQPTDTLFLQVLFAPTKQPWQRNISALLAAERLLGHRAPQGQTTNPKHLDEPLFAASIRIGCTNPALARDIEAFSGTFTADGTPFRYRTMTDFNAVLDHEETLAFLRNRTTHTTGQLLSVGELATFAHPPDQAAAQSVRVDFLQGLPVPARLRSSNGTPLGTNTDRGDPITVFEPADLQNKNWWLLGKSRTGKSTMNIHRIIHRAKTGQGVGLLDPHRTTAFDLLGALDGIEADRVVFLDFDGTTPVAYNPFATADEENYGRLTTEYVNSFKTLLGAEHFHRMAHILAMSIYALFVLRANLATLPDLLSSTPAGKDLRERVAASVNNQSVQRFWATEYYTYTKDAFSVLLNRLSALLLDDKTRRTFAQDQNTIDIPGIMDEGRVLIIAPPASIEAASIVGGIITGQAMHAAFRRAGTPAATRHFHFVIDEFPRFITSSTTLQRMIDETSKGGLSVCLANQETGQIPNDLLKAMYSIPNIAVFGVNLPDAKQLAPLFNGNVTPEWLAGQTTGEVTAIIGGEIANFTTPPPITTNPDTAQRIIAHSQAKYHATPAAARNDGAPRRRARRVIDTIPE